MVGIVVQASCPPTPLTTRPARSVTVRSCTRKNATGSRHAPGQGPARRASAASGRAAVPDGHLRGVRGPDQAQVDPGAVQPPAQRPAAGQLRGAGRRQAGALRRGASATGGRRPHGVRGARRPRVPVVAARARLLPVRRHQPARRVRPDRRHGPPSSTSTYKTEGNHLFYLATAPTLFATVVAAPGRRRAGRPRRTASWRRVIIEKPFGRDLESARELNQQLAKVLGERQTYRIDHYLGKETVQNIMAFRFGNGIFEPIWNRRYIDHVQITGVGGSRRRAARRLLRRVRRAARHGAQPPVPAHLADGDGAADLV